MQTCLLERYLSYLYQIFIKFNPPHSSGGPLWDDVSLSLLESELRGGIDLTNGIPPSAAAEMAKVTEMGSER